MRLPVIPAIVPHPAEDLYEIHERPPVTPSRAVGPRTIPPQVVPRHRDAGGQGGDAETGGAAPQDYSGEERRLAERRVDDRTVLLDTRSGHDRRHDGHRPGTPVEIDEEV